MTDGMKEIEERFNWSTVDRQTFIAHAPEDIRYLLAELKTAREEIHNLNVELTV